MNINCFFLLLLSLSCLQVQFAFIFRFFSLHKNSCYNPPLRTLSLSHTHTHTHTHTHALYLTISLSHTFSPIGGFLSVAKVYRNKEAPGSTSKFVSHLRFSLYRIRTLPDIWNQQLRLNELPQQLLKNSRSLIKLML